MLVPEKDLIAAAKQGDVSAFEQLIAKLDKKMLGLAAGLAASPHEAEDIYQEAMLSAYKALPKFRIDSQFSTWLYRIVANTAVSHRRKLQNKLSRLMVRDTHQGDSDYESYQTPTVDLANQAGIDATANLDGDPQTVLANQQLNRAIHQAMSSLSDKERVAFVLCHQQEAKISDAAEIMQCQQGSVKSYLFRAREKMRSQLQAFIH